MQAFLLTAALGSSLLVAQDRVRIVSSEATPGKPMTVDFIGSSDMMFGGAKAVKGLPYSAEAVNETTQVLADGNRITRKSVSAIYRDSQGRTRNEFSMPSVGPWASGSGEKMINIFDPVSKTSIMLHPDKTAVRNFMTALDGPQWTEGANGAARTMVFSRRIDSARVRNEGGAPKELATTVSEDVVIEGGPVPVAGVARGVGAGVVRMRTSSSGLAMPDIETSSQSFRRESLGKKVIEGVEAEGARIVSTIAAGEIGNERPIEVVDETWFSKEIEALVYSRHSDPRTGESTYRLTNIQRGDQPISLFEMPSDYRLLDDGPRKIELKLRKPANE